MNLCSYTRRARDQVSFFWGGGGHCLEKFTFDRFTAGALIRRGITEQVRSYRIVACSIRVKTQSTNRSNSQTQTCRREIAIKQHMVHGIETAIIVHANIKKLFFDE